MFRRGWMCNCWNLLSNMHQSTRLLQMWLRRRLPKGSQNENLMICLFGRTKMLHSASHLLMIEKVKDRFFHLGPSNRAMQGKGWSAKPDVCSQDRHAQAWSWQVTKFGKFGQYWLSRLNMEPILNTSTRSSCALDYDFKSGTLFWLVSTSSSSWNDNWWWKDKSSEMIAVLQVWCDGGEDLLSIPCWRAEVCSCPWWHHNHHRS